MSQAPAATLTPLLDQVADLHVPLPEGVTLPRWVRARVPPAPRSRVDIDDVVGRGIAQLGREQGGLAGRRVAVGVGSRGVRDVAALVRATVRALQDAGAEPFIVPAMGSHGSSQAEGQAQVLADYGVTAETMGVPVRATMETVEVGRTQGGVPVRVDRFVVESDGAIVVNRVKPHTDFAGDFGSGLAKMAAIGLGNIDGATLVHADGSAELPRVISEWVDVMREKDLLRGGVAVVEDEAGHSAHVEVVAPSGVAGPAEEALLRRAHELHGHLPFDHLDVLLVDRMGKDVSGAGMDTNVIGRFWVPGVQEPEGMLDARTVCVFELTPASHGNASGLGMADMIPRRLADQVDLRATYINSLTSSTGGVRRSRFPMVLPTDRDVVHAAARMCGRRDLSRLRLVRIESTLQVGQMLITEALVDEAQDKGLEIVGDAEPISFTTDGRLASWQ